ncbi:MAG TPA: response regulator [Patescibacteria group bacterium]|jgi:PleD family two-component response regulator|nr:response regulator [Patescibacteria group bacterium]
METLPGRILVVDDHKTNRLKMSFAVKKEGHEVEVAENGVEALEMLFSRPFDLVLLDIVMPVMDGYEVLEKMKGDSRLRDIPVLVISSVQEMDSIVKGIQMGAEDYLPKTFDPIFFKARLDTCLEKKRFRDREVEYLRQVERLTDAAAALENNSFDPDSLTDVADRTDALGQLTRVFQRMAREFYVREQRLKQQVAELRIEVDKAKQTQQVKQIVGSDYFRQLRNQAEELREKLENVDD